MSWNFNLTFRTPENSWLKLQPFQQKCGKEPFTRMYLDNIQLMYMVQSLLETFFFKILHFWLHWKCFEMVSLCAPPCPKKSFQQKVHFTQKNDLWPKTQNTVKNMFCLFHQKLVFFTRFNLYTGCPVKLFTPAFKKKLPDAKNGITLKNWFRNSWEILFIDGILEWTF